MRNGERFRSMFRWWNGLITSSASEALEMFQRAAFSGGLSVTTASSHDRDLEC